MDKKEADLIIWERLKKGDMTACSDCVELHSDGLYRLGLRLLGNEQEAEDIVQETFLNAFKAIDRFDGRSTLGTWLYRIAYNNAMMRLRKKEPLTVEIDKPVSLGQQEEVPRQLFDWCCLPERDLLSAEALDAIDMAIANLSEPLQMVFSLRDIEGLSTAEVSQVLDISESAVKVRLHRARANMREQLADYFEEFSRARDLS